jgi:hypothetical protein
MSDARADIIAGMVEVLAPVMEGPEGLCVTFTVEGDASRWLQFVDDQVNMASFADIQPDALIAELGQAVIISFQPRQHLTVTLAAREPETIAAWIHDYFVRGLDAGEGFKFDAEIEQL